MSPPVDAWLEAMPQPSLAIDDTPSSSARLVDHGGLLHLVARAEHDAGDIDVALRAVEIELRRLSSREVIERRGPPLGFRVEDLLALAVDAPPAHHERARAYLARRLPPSVCITMHEHDRLALRAVFVERRHDRSTTARAYAPGEGGRVRVEALEVHAVEHCNLRCAHCCNSSPYVHERTLSVAEVEALLARLCTALHADVLKIMGGEPLMHPDITGVVRAMKASGVGDAVRLFTNGLLLHRMPDDFWRSLDHLTVSSYASAPVKPALLALIEEKARRFDVVLNVKPVDSFSVMLHPSRRPDHEAQATFDRCWLRHRCLIARNHRFFACTRAAYLVDQHRAIALDDPYPDPERRRDEDSIPLDSPDLAADIASLLGRADHLHACRFCLGGDGPTERHEQLSRDDVRQGRLRRLKLAGAA